ncbi:MAG: carotenoid 1,2-hydratase [Myxococcales bacterium]|nr:carotenoid 1,2-hydratase [Myxococcales bacterium]
MRALKLFAPLIAIPVLALIGLAIWLAFGDRVAGSAKDWQLFQDQKDPVWNNRPTLADATEGEKDAFDFTRNHMEFPQEWWYFNVHLMDEKDRRYGLMIAFLKTGQILGSLTLVRHEKHFSMQQPGLVELNPETLTVAGPSTTLRQLDPGKYEYEFALEHPLAEIKLKMKANKKPLPVGGAGLIDMGPGGESYYYSLTNLSVEGEGEIRGSKVKLQGKGWMDHQWGNWNDRDFDQWHWYSIQLADQTEIMIFEFRRHSKMLNPVCDIYYPDGTTKHNLPFTISSLGSWVSPRTTRSWSVGWRIRLPSEELDLQVLPDQEDQEVTDALWEGVCHVEGTRNMKPIAGLAFYEARHRTW